MKKVISKLNSTVSPVVATVTSGSIPLNQIRISDLNARKDSAPDIASLAKSIEEIGLINPVPLLKLADDCYEAINGSCRLAALVKIRGQEGILNPGEYGIVSWDEDSCIKASIAENTERSDLAPVEEGRHFDRLVALRAKRGEKLSETDLEKIARRTRQHVNEVRQLAAKFHMLPKSWQDQLSRPANCRSSDNSGDEGTLTITHWRHITAMIEDQIPEAVLAVMERAVAEQWTSGRFKHELAKLNEPAVEPTPGMPKVKDRVPDAAPAYDRVLRSLTTAYQWIGRDDGIAKALQALIEQVNQAIKAAVDAKQPEDASKVPAPDKD
jgi:hypothetical protein